MKVYYREQEFEFQGFNEKCYITPILALGRFYEEELLSSILERYGTGGVYVDFGAYIGTHTIFFSQVCKADLVIAIEPIEECVQMLGRNLSANRCMNVEVWPVAVSDKKGRGSRIPAPEGNWGGSNIEFEEKGSIPVLVAGEIITLAPKLIKIDAESMTSRIIDGCRDVLTKHAPILVVEDSAAIEAQLDALNYTKVGTYCATPTSIYEPT